MEKVLPTSDSKEMLKQYLLRLSIFVLSAFVCISVVGFIFSVYDPVFPEQKERMHLLAANEKFDVAVLGSSYANNLYFKNASNVIYMNGPGEDVLETLYKLEKLQEERSWKCILMVVNPTATQFSNAYMYPLSRMRYYNINSIWPIENDYFLYLKGKASNIVRVDKYKSLFRKIMSKPDIKNRIFDKHSGRIHGDLFEESNGNIDKVYARYPYYKNRSLNIEKRLGEKKDPAKYAKSLELSLKNRIAKIKPKGEAKIVYILPSYLDKYQGLFAQDDVDKAIDLFDGAAELQENIVFLNYYNDQRLMDERYYYDNHMNRLGADIFTELVRADLKNRNIECNGS